MLRAIAASVAWALPLTCMRLAAAYPYRLVDEVGQPIGPFRVWLQYAWIPGLAMSRALGDVLAHQ